MLSGLAARLITGPLAFLAAGVIDVAAYGVAAGRAALTRRRDAARR